ncbi:hypothetical protein LXL04_031837 [Taraxacum kok-saghyz]
MESAVELAMVPNAVSETAQDRSPNTPRLFQYAINSIPSDCAITYNLLKIEMEEQSLHTLAISGAKSKSQERKTGKKNSSMAIEIKKNSSMAIEIKIEISGSNRNQNRTAMACAISGAKSKSKSNCRDVEQGRNTNLQIGSGRRARRRWPGRWRRRKGTAEEQGDAARSEDTLTFKLCDGVN